MSGKVDCLRVGVTKLKLAKSDSVQNVSIYSKLKWIGNNLFDSKAPGIDKLKTRDETILYFNDCLQNASKKIPHERKSRAHILLAATAGMRLLR